jgi:hypothetical protein
MKMYSFAGLNAVEVVSTLERISGERLLDADKRALADLAEGQGGTFVKFNVVDQENGKHFDARFWPDDSEHYTDFVARLDQEGRDSMDRWLIEKGPVPAYNGVVGDSHDCPACNCRRSLPGEIDLMHDRNEGLSIGDSKVRTEVGYWKRDMEVPAHATVEASRERYAQRPASLLDILGELERMIAAETQAPVTH